MRREGHSYIRLSTTFAVMRIEGVDRFQNLRWPDESKGMAD